MLNTLFFIQKEFSEINQLISTKNFQDDLIFYTKRHNPSLLSNVKLNNKLIILKHVPLEILVYHYNIQTDPNFNLYGVADKFLFNITHKFSSQKDYVLMDLMYDNSFELSISISYLINFTEIINVLN